jgi:hypothetical protein
MATPQQCPSESALERLAAGAASSEELRGMVAHLLRGCPECVGRLGELLHRPVAEGAYDAVLDRFEEGLRAALETPVGPLSRLWSVMQDGPGGGANILTDLQGGGPPRPAAPPAEDDPAPQPPPSCRIPLTVSDRRSRSMGPSFK